jgi:hypothetical protein
MAVASTFLLCFPAMPGGEATSVALYQPKGLLCLLGGFIPPAAFLACLFLVALLTTWFVFVGLFTRVSMLLSCLTLLTLTWYESSFQAFCCHGRNVMHLAQIALLLGLSGDCLSLDALLRSRFRGHGAAPLPPSDRYRWPVLLAQWAVALMFANAAWYKLKADNYHLGWALSDNLRHILVYQYDFFGYPPTPLVDWIKAEPWRYQTVALANLLSQAMPIFACLFIRRPLVRAVCGSFFVVETVGLNVLMQYRSWNWLPLYALFVDWDRLIAWFAGSPGRRGPASDPPSRLVPGVARQATARHRLLASLFILWFSEYYVLVAFLGADDRNRNYPFASFPMYSGIMAQRPLQEHKPYECAWMRFEYEDEVTLDLQVTFASLYGGYDGVNGHDSDLNQLRETMFIVKRRLEQAIGRQAGMITLKKLIYQIPAYPAPAKAKAIHEGLLASVDRCGTVVGLTVEWH